jgi:hypothetical protein
MKLTSLNDLILDGKTVKGDWELTPNHEVRYRAAGANEEIKLKGALVAADPDALVIAVTEKSSNGKVTSGLVRLSGRWQLNDRNQITFDVAKENGGKDTLTFKSGWNVDDKHKLIYTYRQGKTKDVQELVFNGVWDISDKSCLTYCLGGDSESAFHFRGAFQQKSIDAGKGEVRYQVGVDIKGKPKVQTIALFGQWRVSDDLNLCFEMEYSDREKQSITFGAQYSLNTTTAISAGLKSKHGEPLGVELILTKDIFNNDGQAFVRLKHSLEDSRIEAGMKMRF